MEQIYGGNNLTWILSLMWKFSGAVLSFRDKLSIWRSAQILIQIQLSAATMQVYKQLQRDQFPCRSLDKMIRFPWRCLACSINLIPVVDVA